jgi:hypothetical protein
MDSGSNGVRGWKHILRDPVAWVLVSPAAWSAYFWTLIVASAIFGGRWPQPRSGYPGAPSYDDVLDPDVLGFFGSLVWLSLIALPVLITLGAGVSILSIPFRGLRRPPAAYLAFVIGTFVTCATIGWNFGSCFEWFLD